MNSFLLSFLFLLPEWHSWLSQLQVALRYIGVGGGEEVPRKAEEKEFPGNNVEAVTADLRIHSKDSQLLSSQHRRVTKLNTQEDLGPGILPKSLLVRGF